MERVKGRELSVRPSNCAFQQLIASTASFEVEVARPMRLARYFPFLVTGQMLII